MMAIVLMVFMMAAKVCGPKRLQQDREAQQTRVTCSCAASAAYQHNKRATSSVSRMSKWGKALLTMFPMNCYSRYYYYSVYGVVTDSSPP